MEENRLMITMESRILGDEYVRFGGERLGRFHIFYMVSHFSLSLWGRQDADNVRRRLRDEAARIGAQTPHYRSEGEHS